MDLESTSLPNTVDGEGTIEEEREEYSQQCRKVFFSYACIQFRSKNSSFETDAAAYPSTYLSLVEFHAKQKETIQINSTFWVFLIFLELFINIGEETYKQYCLSNVYGS